MDQTPNVAASLGPGRIVVLQPAWGTTAGLPELALGAQLFWGLALGRSGREALTVGMAWSGARHGPTLLADPTRAPVPELAVWERLCRSAGARFGVSSRFEQPEGEELSINVWLFERRNEALETLGDWTRTCEAPDAAATVFELNRQLALRVGVRLAWGDWTHAFGTGDPEAAFHYLRALGAYNAVELGTHAKPAEALDVLVQVLRLAPTMKPAIDQLPAQFLRVRKTGRVDPLAIARAYRAAVDAVGGRVPEAWRAVDAALRGAN